MLYNKTLYTRPINIYIGEIYEYDIYRANISALYQCGYFSKEDFDNYNRLPKNQRQIAIGLLQKDSSVRNLIKDNIKEARKNLIVSNNIKDDEVISIKNDAIFINRLLQNTEFDKMRFRVKNQYYVFLYIKECHLEIYFGISDFSYNIDVKGIKDNLLPYHAKYLSFISEILNMIYNKNYDKAIEYLIDFDSKYNRLELDIEYYRELNSKSMYRIINTDYLITTISESDKNLLDISYNSYINRRILSIVTELYLRSRRTNNRR